MFRLCYDGDIEKQLTSPKALQAVLFIYALHGREYTLWNTCSIRVRQAIFSRVQFAFVILSFHLSL